MLTTDWLTKNQVAVALEVVGKTVERMARRGELRQVWRQRGGRRPLAIYNPDDVAKVKARLASGDSIPSPVGPLCAEPKGVWRRTAPAKMPSCPVHVKLYLDTWEAAAYSGLPRAFLEQLIKDGALDVHIVGVNSRGQRKRIKRSDLEHLHL